MSGIFLTPNTARYSFKMMRFDTSNPGSEAPWASFPVINPLVIDYIYELDCTFLAHQNSKNIQKIKNLFKTLRKHHNTLLNPEGHRLDRSVGFWPNIHLPLGEVDSFGAAILPFTLKIQCKSNVNCQLLNIKTVNFSSANGYLYLRSQIDSEHILWDLATL